MLKIKESRNKKITERVLNGEKLIAVGIDFSLTTQGVMKAVHSYCKHINPTLYKQIPTDRYSRKIKWLSQNKNNFNIS